MSTRPDVVALGMRVVFDGNLQEMRRDLNMSRTGMAALIGVSPESLRKWESGKQGMKLSTAIKVAKWWLDAQEALDKLPEDTNLSDLVPMVAVVAHLGVSQQRVKAWCDKGEMRYEDLGVLGYFIYRDEVPGIVIRGITP